MSGALNSSTMWIEKVATPQKLEKYLHDRGLTSQYDKAVDLILAENCRAVDLKYRKPKSHNILYFRINRQYRALCKQEGKTLKVFEIHDHQ